MEYATYAPSLYKCITLWTWHDPIEPILTSSFQHWYKKKQIIMKYLMKGILFLLWEVSSSPNISSHVASQIWEVSFLGLWLIFFGFFFWEVCLHLVCSIHKLHHCRYCSVESCFVNFLCDLQTKIIHDNRSSVTISQS